MRPSSRPFRYLIVSVTLCSLVASSLLATGCATSAASPAQPSMAAADAPDAPQTQTSPVLPPGFVPVVRQGRYTLVELTPDLGQRDLMQQVVDVSIPPTFDATVGDALRYILLRSGYRLCDTSDASALYALPLPAAQLHLGPLALRDALLTLAGSDAWELSIDDAGRQVCFSRRAAPLVPSAATASSPEAPSTPIGASPDSRIDPFDALQPWEMQP